MSEIVFSTNETPQKGLSMQYQINQINQNYISVQVQIVIELWPKCLNWSICKNHKVKNWDVSIKTKINLIWFKTPWSYFRMDEYDKYDYEMKMKWVKEDEREDLRIISVIKKTIISPQSKSAKLIFKIPSAKLQFSISIQNCRFNHMQNVSGKVW